MNLRIKAKLQIAFFVFGLGIIGVTGWQAYHIGESSLSELTRNRLVSIRETKKHEIESYFASVSEELLSVARHPAMIRAAEEARMLSVPAVSQKNTDEEPLSFEGLQRCYRMQGKSGYANDTAFLSAVLKQKGAAEVQMAFCTQRRKGTGFESAEMPDEFRKYVQQYAMIDSSVKGIAHRIPYQDVFLVEPKSGRVLYAGNVCPLLGVDIYEPPFSAFPFVHAVQDAAQQEGTQEIRFSDFSYAYHTGGEPLAACSIPVIDRGEVLAVLTVLLSGDMINDIMTNGVQWKKFGLGESGEAYLIGSDTLMRTESRFLIDKPKTFIKALKRMKFPGATIDAVRSRKTTVLLLTVQTEAADAVLAGKTGVNTLDDYRGEDVLSAYAPIDVFGTRWGLLAEIDTREAFVALYALQEKLAFLLFVFLLIAFVVGYSLSRSISDPIRNLARVSEDIGKGDFTVRVDVQTNDEIGDLAHTFNVMAENLEQITSRLQNEVVSRQNAEAGLKESHERLRHLAVHLQSAREEERRSVAREIHDELGQALTALKMELAMLEKRLPDAEELVKERFAGIKTLISDTIQAVKRITTELRPGLLDDLGLSAAIEWQAEEFAKRTGIECRVTCEPQIIIVDPLISTALFRIFQETLTNIARHANATLVTAVLTEKADHVEISVRDNGVGISRREMNKSSSFGILGMQERVTALGGTITIDGVRDSGTRVHAVIPLSFYEAES